MSSDDEKPPAPPVRLTSNRGTDLVNSSIAVDRPLPKEPEDVDRKKKNPKLKKTHKLSTYTSDKPNISYPTNFEHTVHVGFDPVSGEFTVSFESFSLLYRSVGACFYIHLVLMKIFCYKLPLKVSKEVFYTNFLFSCI